MKIAVLITRTLLGLVFFGFGLNFFFHFVPMATPVMSKAATNFQAGLFGAGYFFYVLKGIETISGLFLIINRFTALFLLVLFPIMVNIILFHSFLESAGLPMTVPMFLIELFLIYAYRKYYQSTLTVSPVVG